MIPLLLIACLGAEPLPLVQEHYDALVVLHESNPQGWNATNVYFVRDGKVIADRSVDERMLWTVHEGQPALVWEDWQCSRIVTCDAVVWGAGKRKADEGEWWAMGRAMTELRAPQETK